MPIATIRENAWADASEQPDRRLAGRICVVSHARPAFVVAELVLLSAASLYGVRAGMHLAIPLLIAFCAVSFHLGSVDKSIVERRGGRRLIQVLVCVALGMCTSLLALRLFPDGPGARPGVWIVAAWCLLAAGLPLALGPVLRNLVLRNQLIERILIVGGGELALKLARIAADGWSNAKTSKTAGPVSLPGSPVAIDLARLEEIMARARISRVIVAEQNAEHRRALAKALLDPRLHGVQVDEAVRLYERFCGKIWIEGLTWEWFVYAGVHRSRASLFLKRALDVAFAVLLILAAAPLMGIIAVAIRLDSRGPVLFRQVRVGLHGKTFFILKFRSMRQDAECETGPVWASECDGRATRIGRILRRFRLDEIPQAFNVLRGEMSVIGPRPERPYFVDELAKHIPFYNFRHRAKPGITGWAQVMYRYGDSVEDAFEKLQYDFYYTKHESPLCDLRILLKTVEIVLFGRGR